MHKSILSKCHSFIVSEEAQPTIFLLGFKQTHQVIKECLSNDKKKQGFVDLSFRYFSYDYGEIPTHKNRPKNSLITESWLEKIALRTPTLCLLVFDWSSPQSLDLDWKNYESMISVEFQRVRSQFSTTQNPTRNIILLLLHADYQGGGSVYEKIQSIRKMAEIDSSSVFISTNGIDGLGVVQKKLQKQALDHCQSYCKAEKKRIKRKLQKTSQANQLGLTPGSTSDSLSSTTSVKEMVIQSARFIRGFFKLGYLAEIIKGKHQSLGFFENSYRQIQSLNEEENSICDPLSLRDIADLVVFKICKLHLETLNSARAQEQFIEHLQFFSRNCPEQDGISQILELAWRADKLRKFATLLIDYQKGINPILNYELFPGYYYKQSGEVERERMKLYKIFKPSLDERFAQFQEIKSSFLQDPLQSSVAKDDSNLAYINYLKMFLSEEFKLDHQKLTLDMLKESWEWYRKHKDAQRMSTILGFQISQLYHEHLNYAQSRKHNQIIRRYFLNERWMNLTTEVDLKLAEAAIESKNMAEHIQNQFQLFKYSTVGSEEKSTRFNNALQLFSSSEEQIDAKLYLDRTHSMIWCTGHFQKESIERFDYTTLHLNVYSQVNLDLEFSRMRVKFNEPSLDKMIEQEGIKLNRLDKEGPIEKYQFMIYANSQVNKFISVSNIIFEYASENGSRLELLMTPGKEHLSIVNAQDTGKDVLVVEVTEPTQKIKIDYPKKNEAVIGDHFAFPITLIAQQTHKVIGGEIILSAESNVQNIGALQPKKRKPRASVASYDRAPSVGQSFLVYKEEDNDFKNLGFQNYTLTFDNIQINSQDVLTYIIYFIEEGEEALNLTVNYTVAKVYEDGSEAQPFQLTITEKVKFTAIRPFRIDYEWTFTEPTVQKINNALQASTTRSNRPPIKLPVNETCSISAKISTHSQVPMRLQTISLLIHKDHSAYFDIHGNSPEPREQLDTVIEKGEAFSVLYLIEGKSPLSSSPFAQMQIEFSIEKDALKKQSNDQLDNLFSKKGKSIIKCYLPYHGEVSLIEPLLSVKLKQLASSYKQHIPFEYVIEIQNNRPATVTLETRLIEQIEPGMEELSFIHAGQSFSEVMIAPFMKERLSYILIPVSCGYHLLPRVKLDLKGELNLEDSPQFPSTVPDFSPFASVFINP